MYIRWFKYLNRMSFRFSEYSSLRNSVFLQKSPASSDLNKYVRCTVQFPSMYDVLFNFRSAEMAGRPKLAQNSVLGICDWLTPWLFTRITSSSSIWTTIHSNKNNGIEPLVNVDKSAPWNILSHWGQRFTWHTKHRWIRLRFCFKLLVKCLLSS